MVWAAKVSKVVGHGGQSGSNPAGERRFVHGLFAAFRVRWVDAGLSCRDERGSIPLGGVLALLAQPEERRSEIPEVPGRFRWRASGK